MTRLIPAALPLLALLAACNGQSPANDTAPVNEAAAATNGTDAAAIRALPVGQRNAVFLRAVRDSGADCQEVTQATEQPVASGPATWAVSCDRQGRFVVAIDTAGTATVTPAAALPKG
jgi:hypothetical protein